MTVAVYQCDVCKRIIHKTHNRLGIDVVGRCSITNGCRGRLTLQQKKPSHAIGKSTDPVDGLADWTPRKVLFTYRQEFLKQTWDVVHNLQNIPTITTHIWVEGELVRVEPTSIVTIDPNTTRLTFATAVSGIVQCQARSASDGLNVQQRGESVSVTAGIFDISNASNITGAPDPGEITIATRVATHSHPTGFDVHSTVRINLKLLNSSIDTVPLVFRDVSSTPVSSFGSPWGDAKYAIINGHRYLLRSTNVHTSEGGRVLLSSRGIPDGAQYYFDVVDSQGASRHYEDDDILILLTDPPHGAADRIADEVVRMCDISASTATASTAFIDDTLLCTNGLRRKVFPSIILA